MNLGEKPKKRKWRSTAWLSAVFAATTKIRVIRVGHAFFQACDAETGATWSGRDRIHKLSRISDLDNFRKAMKGLEDLGAINIKPFETMPAAMKAAATAAGKSHEGMWYSMNFEWSDSVLASENDPVNLTAMDDDYGQNDRDDPVNLTAMDDDYGQNDRDDPVNLTADDRSNRPGSDGQIDPPYLPFISSHQSSQDLLSKDGAIDLEEMIMKAIDSRDDNPLRMVSLREMQPRLENLIGRDLFDAWLERSKTWDEIIGGLDGEARQQQSA